MGLIDAGRAEGLTVLPLSADERTIRRWAGPVAEMTRQAYAGSDPVPGLPVPDGAADTAADVAADLRGGAVAWLAVGSDRAPAGVVRIRDHGACGWEISRLATVPVSKQRGVGRTILAAVERCAASEGVPRIWLNAVIERCLPPYYARLGFTVVDHWPSPDKPLTEFTMQRIPGSPTTPREFPMAAAVPASALPASALPASALPASALPAFAVPAWDGAAICWFTVGAALWVVVEEDPASLPAAVSAAARRLRAVTPGAARFAGIDVPGAEISDPRSLLADLGGGDPTVRQVAADRLSVRGHLMPRTLHPALLAGWRLPPGREAPVPERTYTL